MKKDQYPQSTSLIKQFKDTTYQTQLLTILKFLHDPVATASMVTDATGIYQRCITRYKRDLEKAGMLWEVDKQDCQKTGFKAWYLTPNPSMAPKRRQQIDLFGKENEPC